MVGERKEASRERPEHRRQKIRLGKPQENGPQNQNRHSLEKVSVQPSALRTRKNTFPARQKRLFLQHRAMRFGVFRALYARQPGEMLISVLW